MSGNYQVRFCEGLRVKYRGLLTGRNPGSHMNNNNRPMLFANAHMMLVYELQSARNRLCLLGILHTDDEIDAIADAAIAEIEKFRGILKITVPELQAPTPDTIEALLRRDEPTKSDVWSPSAVLECYVRRHYPPPFHFESGIEGK